MLSDGTFYGSLSEMTGALAVGYRETVALADNDGSTDFAGIAPVGEAFQRAVDTGSATGDFRGPDAMTDDMIDLWFDDGTHATVFGSNLSALVMDGTLTGQDPSLSLSLSLSVRGR